MTSFAQRGRRAATGAAVGSIGTAALHCIVMITMAVVLILVVLPAVLGAAS
jgi:hypothetical protein